LIDPFTEGTTREGLAVPFMPPSSAIDKRVNYLFPGMRVSFSLGKRTHYTNHFQYGKHTVC
jgi:hypothetical protein